MQKIFKINQQVLQKIREIEQYLDQYNDNQDADPIFYQKLVKQQSLQTPVQGLAYPVQTTESFYFTDSTGTTYYSGKGFMLRLENEFLIVPLDSSDEQTLLQLQVQELELEPGVPLTYNDILSDKSYPIYSGDFQILEEDTQDKIIVFPLELLESGDNYYLYERIILRSDIETDQLEIRYTNDELNQQGTYLDDIFHVSNDKLSYFLEYFGIAWIDLDIQFTSMAKFYTDQHNYFQYNSDFSQLDLYQYDDDPDTLDGVLPKLYFRKPQTIDVQHETNLFINKKTFIRYQQLRSDLMTEFQYLGNLIPVLDVGITNPIILDDPDQYNFELKQSWDPQQQQTVENQYYFKMSSDTCILWLFCEPIQDYDTQKIDKMTSGQIFQTEITRPVFADIQQSQQNLQIPNEDQNIENKIDDIRIDTTIQALKLDYGNKMTITPTDIQNKIQSMTFDEQELELIEQQSGITVQTLKEEMQKLQIKRETSQGQTFTPEQINEFMSQIFIDNMENIVQIKYEIPEEEPDSSNKEFSVKHYINGYQPEEIVRETVKVNSDNKQQYSSYGNDTAIDTIDYENGIITFLIQPKEIVTFDYDYLIEILDEPQLGSKNGFNNVFSTENCPIYPNSITINLDGNIITDDGQGNLSDGGMILYDTGQFVLTSYPLPLSTLSCTYKYVIEQTNVEPSEIPDGINMIFHQPNTDIQIDTLKYKIDPRFQIDKTRPYEFDPGTDTYIDLTTIEMDIDTQSNTLTFNLPSQQKISVQYKYITEFVDVIPEGVIDGINNIFIIDEYIRQGSLIITLNGSTYTEEEQLIETEIPLGIIDGNNYKFQLQNENIVSGSLEITVDGESITESTIEDDLGILSDNGIIDYSTGIIYLKDIIPTTEITVTYRYFNGNITGIGNIDYTTGIITFDSQPQLGSIISCQYNTATPILEELPEGEPDYNTTVFTLQNQGIIRSGLIVNFEGIILEPDYDGIAIYYRDRQGKFIYSDGIAQLNQQPEENITISYNYKIQLWPVQNQMLNNEKIVVPPEFLDEFDNKKVQLQMYVVKIQDMNNQITELLGDHLDYSLDYKIQIVVPPMLFDVNKYSDNNDYTLQITQSKIFGFTDYQTNKSSLKMILRDNLTSTEINRTECPLYFGNHEKQNTPATKLKYSQNNSNFQVEIPQSLFQQFTLDNLSTEEMFYISHFYDIQNDDFYMDEEQQAMGREPFKYVLFGFINQPGIIDPIPETLYVRIDYCNFQKLNSTGLFLSDL